MNRPTVASPTAVATTFATIDDYIGCYPSDVQGVLQEIRRTMHGVVPGADETISYKIPTITLDDRPLIYFAGWSAMSASIRFPTATRPTSHSCRRTVRVLARRGSHWPNRSRMT